MTESVCPVCQSILNNEDAQCPTCHFNLSGTTQSFKPVAPPIDQPKNNPSKTSTASLKMVRGPQIGAIYQLSEDATSIGRNPKCDIFLNDMTVSREHAEILLKDDIFIINDLQSYNGVWVNNYAINEYALKPGDYIQIGKYDFVFEETK